MGRESLYTTKSLTSDHTFCPGEPSATPRDFSVAPRSAPALCMTVRVPVARPDDVRQPRAGPPSFGKQASNGAGRGPSGGHKGGRSRSGAPIFSENF